MVNRGLLSQNVSSAIAYSTLHYSSNCSRVSGSILDKIISSFILLFNHIHRLFIGIDSSGFKTTNASQYYTYKAKIQKKYVKLSVSADMLFQLICIIKIRRAPTKHDIIDFPPLVIKASEILPKSVTVADKGYDSEDNHVLVREYIHALSIIPPRYQSVPLWRTYGRYRKQMKKRGYSRILYNQRNKDETIMSVIKTVWGAY